MLSLRCGKIYNLRYRPSSAGNARARKSLGAAKGGLNTAACKVSAWRNPKDRPSKIGGPPPDKSDLQRSKYEGPDQDLAAQLER